MTALVVGVGDCRFSRDPGEELVTFALGSCIGVAVWDPSTKASGLLHFMLPEKPAQDPVTKGNVFRYADTGVPLLFRSIYELGGEKRRLVVRLAGGAAVVDDGGVFNIGRRNYAALKKLLWKAGVLVQGESVGGSVSRNVRLEVATGRLFIKEAGAPEREMPAHAAGRRTGEAA